MVNVALTFGLVLLASEAAGPPITITPANQNTYDNFNVTAAGFESVTVSLVLRPDVADDFNVTQVGFEDVAVAPVLRPIVEDDFNVTAAEFEDIQVASIPSPDVFDTTAPTESVSLYLPLTVTVEDTVEDTPDSDSITINLPIQPFVWDDIVVTDSLALDLTGTTRVYDRIIDYLIVGESVTVVLVTVVVEASLSESIPVTEAIVVTLVNPADSYILVQGADEIQPTESVTVLLSVVPLLVVVQDTISPTEVIVVATKLLTVEVSDSIAIDESIRFTWEPPVLVGDVGNEIYDAISVTESVEVIMAVVVYVWDNTPPVEYAAGGVNPIRPLVADLAAPAEFIHIALNPVSVYVVDLYPVYDVISVTIAPRKVTVNDTWVINNVDSDQGAGAPTWGNGLRVQMAYSPIIISIFDLVTPIESIGIPSLPSPSTPGGIPITPLSRQKKWSPTWLIDLTTAADIVIPDAVFQSDTFDSDLFQTEGAPLSTFRFSTRDIDKQSPPYRGRVIQNPSVRRSMADTFWGSLEQSEFTFTLENKDEALTELYTNDARNQPVTIHLYDWESNTIVKTYYAVIGSMELGAGTLSITAKSPDLMKFEQLVPAVTVTTELFGERAVDVGKAIPVVFGSARKIPIVYVNDNVRQNRYDYIVGHGVLEIDQLYRDGPDGTFVKITKPEYAVSTTLYPGYTSVRFRVRQQNFQNAFHTIYADVTENAANKNFARAVEDFLTNSTWGLDLDVDTGSFTTAKADLDSVGSLFCDGAMLDQRQAQEWLRQLLMVRGIRLGVNASGQWTIAVDKAQTAIALEAADSTGDGERTILRMNRRSRPDYSNAISTYKLSYFPDYAKSEFRFTQKRTVYPFGQEREIENNFIRDHVTADKVIDYLGKREYYGSDVVEMELTQEARGLDEGNLVFVTYPTASIDAATMEVTEIEKDSQVVRVTAAGWSPSIFLYAPGELPTDPIEEDPLYRIPRPGGLELVGPPRVEVGEGEEQMIGLGNEDEWTGRDVRFQWHAIAALPNRGLDEDNFDKGAALIRDYQITFFGTVTVP